MLFCDYCLKLQPFSCHLYHRQRRSQDFRLRGGGQTPSRAGETGGPGDRSPLGPHKCPFRGPEKSEKRTPLTDVLFLFSELYRWSLNILYPGSWSPTDPSQPVGPHWVFGRQVSMWTFCESLGPQCVCGPSVTMWALSESVSPRWTWVPLVSL